MHHPPPLGARGMIGNLCAAAQVLPVGAVVEVSSAADGARHVQVHEGLQLLRRVEPGRPDCKR